MGVAVGDRALPNVVGCKRGPLILLSPFPMAVIRSKEGTCVSHPAIEGGGIHRTPILVLACRCQEARPHLLHGEPAPFIIRGAVGG